MIDHGLIHRPQNAIRNVGRPRNLKKMPTGVVHDRAVYTRKYKDPKSPAWLGGARERTGACVSERKLLPRVLIHAAAGTENLAGTAWNGLANLGVAVRSMSWFSVDTDFD